MSQLTYLILIVKLTLAFGLQQTTPSNHFILEGLDCRNPTRIASFLSREWCTPTSISRGDPPKGKKTVTVVQDAKFQILNGIRCTKQISRFLVYCGSYSHMKLYGPPTILEPSVITPEECSDMYRRRAYIYMGKNYKD